MEFKEFKTKVETLFMKGGAYERHSADDWLLILGEMSFWDMRSIHEDREGFIVDMGASLASIINACFMLGIDPSECMAKAWEALKKKPEDGAPR